MAADQLFYLLLLPLLVVPILLLRSRSSASRGYGSGRLPPEPWALPVIGHLHHLLGGGLPHRRMRDLARRHGPLMLLRLGEVQAVVASSAEAARQIMKTHDVAFATRPMGPLTRLWYQDAGGGVVFAPYGDGWWQLRKICTVELLSSRRVHAFRPISEAEVGRLLRSVAASAAAAPEAPVNLTSGIALYVLDSTVRAIIGSRQFMERDEYLQMLKDVTTAVPGMGMPDLFPSCRLAMRVSRMPAHLMRSRTKMHRLMDVIIKEHQEFRPAGQEEEDEDLVDVLLRLQKEADFQYPLTADNIKFVMLDMFGAGSDTSSTALLWATAELMRNPLVRHKLQDKLRREFARDGRVVEERLRGLSYLHMVIKETLRLHPPLPLLIPHQCGSPCQVLGYDVPVGATAMVNAWAIGRDPAAWGDAAERFERCGRDFRGADFELIPFGAGRRMCPGVAQGLAHVELALAALLFHFDLELPAGMAPEEVDMTEVAGVTTWRKAELRVILLKGRHGIGSTNRLGRREKLEGGQGGPASGGAWEPKEMAARGGRMTRRGGGSGSGRQKGKTVVFGDG